MKNEEVINYDFGSITEKIPESIPENTMLTNARIELKGYKEPTIQIQNRRELEKYCGQLLGNCAFEECHAIYVDGHCRILAEICVGRGSLSSVNVEPRTICTGALLTNAHSVFLTHNHPGGTCAPSTDDILSTKRIKSALGMFGITLLDHMICCPNGQYYSFAQHSDL